MFLCCDRNAAATRRFSGLFCHGLSDPARGAAIASPFEAEKGFGWIKHWCSTAGAPKALAGSVACEPHFGDCSCSATKLVLKKMATSERKRANPEMLVLDFAMRSKWIFHISSFCEFYLQKANFRNILEQISFPNRKPLPAGGGEQWGKWPLKEHFPQGSLLWKRILGFFARMLCTGEKHILYLKGWWLKVKEVVVIFIAKILIQARSVFVQARTVWTAEILIHVVLTTIAPAAKETSYSSNLKAAVWVGSFCSEDASTTLAAGMIFFSAGLSFHWASA